MVNPAPRTCVWATSGTSENNNTIAQVCQVLTDHMTTHTLNAGIAAMARRGMEQAKQPNQEPNGLARNVVVKQRNAPSYINGKEIKFKELVKIRGEWDEEEAFVTECRDKLPGLEFCQAEGDTDCSPSR